MNPGRKLKSLRKEILKYGTIIREGHLPPDNNYYYYRKGSYFIHFQSDFMSACIGDVNKYHCHQSLMKEIRYNLKNI